MLTSLVVVAVNRRPALICKPSLCFTFVCKLTAAGKGWTVFKDIVRFHKMADENPIARQEKQFR